MKQLKGKIIQMRGHMKLSSFFSQEGNQIISTRQNILDRKPEVLTSGRKLNEELCCIKKMSDNIFGKCVRKCVPLFGPKARLTLK